MDTSQWLGLAILIFVGSYYLDCYLNRRNK